MTSKDPTPLNLDELRKRLEAVYNCRFCDGKKKLWDTKRNKYIPCPHTEVTDKLQDLFTNYTEQAVLVARINELTTLDNAYDVFTEDNFHNYYIKRLAELNSQEKDGK